MPRGKNRKTSRPGDPAGRAKTSPGAAGARVAADSTPASEVNLPAPDEIDKPKSGDALRRISVARAAGGASAGLVHGKGEAAAVEAGRWRLQCRQCGSVFEVEIGAGEELERVLRAHPCPGCLTVPWNRPRSMQVHWHEIVDHPKAPRRRR